MANITKGIRVQVVYDYKHEADEMTGRPGTVWVRVYVERTKRKYISTGVRVLPSQWSNEWHVIRHPNAVELNEQIEAQVSKCRKLMSEAINKNEELPTIEMMKRTRNEASFLDYVAEHIDLRLSPKTVIQHRNWLRLFTEYGKIRKYEDVTSKNINDYLQWIRSREVKISDAITGEVRVKNCDESTVAARYCILQKYVRLAIKDGHIPSSALAKVNVPHGKSKEREHLTIDEIELWQSYKPRTSMVEIARDLFLLQMSCGMAFIDIKGNDFAKYELINGMIAYSGRRHKTGTRYFSVVLPMAMPILEKWNYKIPKISLQCYNLYVKAIARELGIRKVISSHVARHTYACLCLSQGVRIEAVQMALGHERISTTQIYAKMANMDVVNAFAGSKLFDK